MSEYVSLFIRNTYPAKEQTHGFTARSTTTLHNDSVILPPGSTFDCEGRQLWCNAPDMLEGQTRKATSPIQCNTNSTNCRQEFITTALSALETAVAVFPNTINGMGAFYFCKYVMETDL